MKRKPVSHYLIPGTELELIDVLQLCLSPAEFQACLWFSLEQYGFRWWKKGDAVNDLEKLVTYSSWLLESVRENGVCMGQK
jgi:hypothetical protein